MIWPFRCRHRHTSRVFGRLPDVHVVCFDCGRRLRYDWAKMRIEKRYNWLMKTSLLLLLISACSFGQIVPIGDMLVSSGVSVDYANHQPSANFSVAPHVANLAGMPTYSVTSFETSLRKAAGQTSNTLTLRTGILQIPWHSNHFGVFVLTDGGVVKFDLATLSTFTGGVGAYVDLGGIVTKDHYHGWLSPMLREVSIAGQQIKPVYGIQFTTVFSRSQQ